MNKIHIVNWLLTRRCNLSCDYCRIVRNYKNKPVEYPNIRHYVEHEMDTETVINGLKKLKLHNPDCFMIFYGGEPTLREDLYQIVNYCNDNNIHYTIISNNIDEERTNKLLSKVSYIEGYTASIDPIIYMNGENSDIVRKSLQGLEKLTELKDKIKDVVAEITVTNDNLPYLYTLVKELTNRGINSDITFIDISKSNYYDFSNVEDKNILVNQTIEVKEILDQIVSEKLNVHMSDTLLPMIYKYLPSEYNCNLEKDFHNLCIDGDGSCRLCLRIRGVFLPYHFNIHNIINNDGILNENINRYVYIDKYSFCKGCNHTCYYMSELISKNLDISNNLIHKDIREI